MLFLSCLYWWSFAVYKTVDKIVVVLFDVGQVNVVRVWLGSKEAGGSHMITYNKTNTKKMPPRRCDQIFTVSLWI